MFEPPSNPPRITVIQDGIHALLSKLFCAQRYDIFVDGEPMGMLDGYRNRSDFSLAPGAHSIYVRAYARASVSLTRVYGYSETLAVELAPGQHLSFSCGLVPGPPLRAPLVLGGALITLLLAIGVGPIGSLPLRTHYGLTMIAALATLVCAWIGYSSKPGSGIYLRPTTPAPQAKAAPQSGR